MGYSKQRALILRALADSGSHLTADEIYAILKKDHPQLSLATVYRNLNGLAESGVILRIHIPGSPDRFDATTAQHNHLLCSVCGVLVDIPEFDMEEILTQLMEQTGARIQDRSVLFYGQCAACAARADAKNAGADHDPHGTLRVV